MKKYLLIFKRVGILSLLRSFAYPIDLSLGVITGAAYMLLHFGAMYFMFQSKSNVLIGGFAFQETLLVFLLSEIVTSLTFIFIWDSLRQVRSQILQGKLDFFLLKPANPHFLLHFQQFYIKTSISTLPLSLLGLFILLVSHSITLSLGAMFAIGYICILSFFASYAINVCATALSFYAPNLNIMVDFLIDEVTRYPKDIFPQWIQGFMLWIIPFFLIVNPVYEVLRGTYTLQLALIHTGILLAFTLISWSLWIGGVRRYNSAN